jgi:hypothetical protein
MRHISLIGFALCALVVAACDDRPLPRIGLVEPVDSTGSTTGTLTIIPNRVDMIVGGAFQFRTNAPIQVQNDIQWISSQPEVASTSPSGLVRALRVGTTTIIARYSFDTTTFGSAVVVVNPGTGMTP